MIIYKTLLYIHSAANLL